ncbi:MAG: metallophosphoesterase [Bacteroidetes bacterium]|nr:metallophosphoesterase [Bacteroidota bacterium]
MRCFFVSDLHGHQHRYNVLFDRIAAEVPDAVFLGGDLLPAHARSAGKRFPPVRDFIGEYLSVRLQELHDALRDRYPRVFLILGNDDPRMHEERLRDARHAMLWTYLHEISVEWKGMTVFGYAYVPPTPFRLKDWERYDISRFVDPGCIAPEDGKHTVPVDLHTLCYGSMQEDLEMLTAGRSLERAIMLFHSPPYQTALDRAALDGQSVDHVPLDVHVGSVAIRRLIDRKQPCITLHGHIHESASITGAWKQQLGRTWAFSAAHNGSELALVRFDTDRPEDAERELI